MAEEVRILCVDDEENVLKSLERLFLDDDYEIITASTIDDALDILNENEPVQIIISDYRMPKMNGIDFLKMVYKYWPDAVRIVFSGYADISTIVDAVNEGHIYGFIPKPWNDEEMKITIATALDHYYAQQKNIQLAKELELRNRELHDINLNLEKLVQERTADLKIRNKILTATHTIFDALPVGVVGIDPDGTIIKCNREGMKIVSSGDDNIIGADRLDVLSEEMNNFMGKVIENGSMTQRVTNNGSVFDVKGINVNCDNGQEGIILVFEEISGENKIA